METQLKSTPHWLLPPHFVSPPWLPAACSRLTCSACLPLACLWPPLLPASVLWLVCLLCLPSSPSPKLFPARDLVNKSFNGSFWSVCLDCPAFGFTPHPSQSHVSEAHWRSNGFFAIHHLWTDQKKWSSFILFTISSHHLAALLSNVFISFFNGSKTSQTARKHSVLLKIDNPSDNPHFEASSLHCPHSTELNIFLSALYCLGALYNLWLPLLHHQSHISRRCLVKLKQFSISFTTLRSF